MGIGARKITISTVGLPKQIRQLAEEELQVTLALSLHAPTDPLRADLIPWAGHISMASLLEACDYYFERTGREITLEYILLAGRNDTPGCAAELAAVARRIRSNVNLIPFNPVAGLPFRRPTDAEVHRFLDDLRRRGTNAHVRWSRGVDIDGACGQLRRRTMDSWRDRPRAAPTPAAPG
jgi:23S rRNA (adenine2503-C2)-methyltransferase